MAKQAEVCASDYRAENDARTLTGAQEIRADGKRYKKACRQLYKQARSATDALSLEQKVKKGLKAVFSPSEKEKH